ncbi:MAG: hypothetical protein WKF63_01895 [Thermomicrobiales bacterium]
MSSLPATRSGSFVADTMMAVICGVAAPGVAGCGVAYWPCEASGANAATATAALVA